jgi:hypothetical protein
VEFENQYVGKKANMIKLQDRLQGVIYLTKLGIKLSGIKQSLAII